MPEPLIPGLTLPPAPPPSALWDALRGLPEGLDQLPRTLLLVEDSRHAAEAMRLLARRLGLRLRRADSLAMAHCHLAVYRPDVAVIDLGLPDGSGLDLIADLGARAAPLRRVVAISADPYAEPEALAAGADAFIAKPLRLPRDLAALLGAPAALPPSAAASGEDPLALRDDLSRARTILARDGVKGLDYAARFVEGVALCAGDPQLLAVAARARRRRDPSVLRNALESRVTGSMQEGLL